MVLFLCPNLILLNEALCFYKVLFSYIHLQKSDVKESNAMPEVTGKNPNLQKGAVKNDTAGNFEKSRLE